MIKAKIIHVSKYLYTCTDCGHEARNYANMAKHVEDRHMNYGGLSCHTCGKHCASRNALATHFSRYHRS